MEEYHFKYVICMEYYCIYPQIYMDMWYYVEKYNWLLFDVKLCVIATWSLEPTKPG